MNTIKNTAYFEHVNGYLVRLYDTELLSSNPTIPYKAVIIIEINGKHATAKGLLGDYDKKNDSDINNFLYENGVEVCTYERYDAHGKLKKSITRKITLRERGTNAA